MYNSRLFYQFIFINSHAETLLFNSRALCINNKFAVYLIFHDVSRIRRQISPLVYTDKLVQHW